MVLSYFFSRLGAENVRSDVTGNVKCILETLFGHQNFGELCSLEGEGGYGIPCPPAPPPKGFSISFYLVLTLAELG